jgi:phosphomannomutase
MSNVPLPSWLRHVPVPLSFGTSGLRGLVADLTDLEAYVNVKGALRYLLSVGDLPPGGGVVVAGDLRPSTGRILRASVRAIRDLGCEVENAGLIPTPALLLHSTASGRAGVMVTGSHIPFDRNGIKVNKRAGEVLKSDEAGIVAEVARVRAEEYGRAEGDSAFDPAGMLKRPEETPGVDGSAEERYVARYLQSFAPGGLRGRRVLVYQHSAVGRDLVARILRELGAEVVTAGRSETFVPIDTENITPAQLDAMEALAAAAGAPLDAIVSTDGDSDRPLMLAVAPGGAGDGAARRVRFLPGDLLGIVAAEYLRADAAVVPISANDAVETRMRERGVRLVKCRIGSPYVVAGIDALREGPAARIVGWEANGGFLTGSAFALAAGTITALATRDATLPILANLYAAAEQGVSLDALWRALPPRSGSAGLVDGVPVATSRAIVDALVPAGDVTEVEFAADGRVLGHGAGGAVALPDADADAWRQRRATLARFFTPARGFDDIARINVLDGVRAYFRNGDVAHLRPSGNAPQLRIYANSASQERADEIVALGVRSPGGILDELAAAFG